MELKVSLDNITITAYIKPIKLLDLKSLIESHTAIIVQTAMTDMFRAITRDGSHVRLLLDYDKLKGQAFNARPFRIEFNPNKLRQIDINILDTIIYLKLIVVSLFLKRKVALLLPKNGETRMEN